MVFSPRREFVDGGPSRKLGAEHMIRIALVVLLVVGVVFGPRWWVGRVFSQYGGRRDDFPGTGGDLARHLLDRFEMKDVKVETTELGDHYDPENKVVRLTRDKFDGKSLTAVTVAAHEVGHAMQDHTGFQPLAERSRLVRIASVAEKAGAVVMLGIPLVTVLAKTPAAGAVMLFAGMATMGVAAIVHLVTLPVEWDASFRRALPVLHQGNYLSPKDMQGARRILTAAAFTYVAVSLASLLNLWRWVALLRRW